MKTFFRLIVLNYQLKSSKLLSQDFQERKDRMKYIGTRAYGIRTPIIRKGDNLIEIVTESVINASKKEDITLNDGDIIALTEAIVAISQGNYATIDHIAKDIRAKYPSGHVGLVFPILSRNRFSLLLKGIAQGVDKLTILLSYPADEVGNHLISWDDLDRAGINPYTDVLTEQEFRTLFKDLRHHFTKVDYVEYYKSLGNNIEIIFGNDPRVMLKYTKDVLVADIHNRSRTKRLLKDAEAHTVYGLDEILTTSIDGSGFNPQYGLLGSNMATDNMVKLFPRDCDLVVKSIQETMLKKTGKHFEVMVYGDGAFKDPVGRIWELADPVVAPAYTEGLQGTPNELKLKYLVDNELSTLNSEEVQAQVIKAIKEKSNNLGHKALGTTPRQITDLLGSLCDLISGSGDKGTPVVLIQNYFSNYASQ